MMSETAILLRMAASLPCDPRHKQLLNKAADEIDQLQRENDALRAERKEIEAAGVENSHEKKVSDILYSHMDRLKDPDPDCDPLHKIVGELAEAFDAEFNRNYANSLRQQGGE